LQVQAAQVQLQQYQVQALIMLAVAVVDTRADQVVLAVLVAAAMVGM
jgi:hypothetical protein